MAYLFRLNSKKSKKFKTLLSIVGIVGVLLVTYGYHLKYRASVLSFASVPAVVSYHERSAKPVNIKIPAASIEVLIEEGFIEDGIWKISDTGASFLNSGARPGEEGNIIIYGHNKPEIFGNLKGENLVGTLINLMTEDGQEYVYEVKYTKTVNPFEIEEVLPTNEEVLTVYTCTGFLDSKRLILKAYPQKAS